MATLVRGQTFGATETITNTKLHNLVDLATISGIVNADCAAGMALVDTKLADITSGGKVRGTSILNLPSVPSGAGLIPIANVPNISVTMLSLMSIPNGALLPITLASWVDGMALRNLGSTPVDRQFRYQTIVSSLASGSVGQYNGANNFIGKTPVELFSGAAVLARFTNAGTTPSELDETDGYDIYSNFASNVFTTPSSGRYLINLNIQLTKDATATERNPQLQFRKNGSLFYLLTEKVTESGEIFNLKLNVVLNLVAGDTIDLNFSDIQSCTATVNDITLSWLGINKLIL